MTASSDISAAPPLGWNGPEALVSTGPIQQSESLGNLAAALVQFQSEVTGAKKGGKNPHFQSTFTRLEDAWKASREALTGNGLSVTQWLCGVEGSISVCTRVLHTSGQWMQSTLTMGLDDSGKKNVPQQYASATSYAQRYAFLAALGLPPADDDGEGARAPKTTALPRGKFTTWSKKLRACDDLGALKAVWGLLADQVWQDMTPEQHDEMTGIKDECKDALEADNALA